MKEYDIYLQRWKDRGLQMHEFWPKVEGEEERKQRVHELTEVDEFRMIMLAVCTITHGVSLAIERLWIRREFRKPQV